MGDSFVGLQARLMSQAMRKLAGTLNRTGTICLFTNQIREKIGVMFGSPETQPGGRALKFYASVRMDIRRIETLKDGSDAYGNRVRVKVVKNKVAPPFRQAEFDVIYGDGISWEGSVLDVGIERNAISKSGSFLSFGETRLGQGRERAKAFLREHPDILQAILDKIQEGLEGVVVPGATLPAPGMAIGEIPPSAEVEAAEVGAVAPAPDVAAKNGVATA
jgi:recombination protein RecA